MFSTASEMMTFSPIIDPLSQCHNKSLTPHGGGSCGGILRVGLGMFGEQGAESIQLERTYGNGVQPLNRMVTEHYRQIYPENIIRQPPTKIKKTEE